MSADFFRQHMQAQIFEQRLQTLLGTAPEGDTRQYLCENPDLVSERALQVLDNWLDQIGHLPNEDPRRRLLLFRSLIENVWPICVCAPLAMPADVRPYTELSDAFAALGVSRPSDLDAVDTDSSQRLKLLKAAFELIPDVEWGILVLLAVYDSGTDLLFWLQELAFLIEYEAETVFTLLEEWAGETGLESLRDRLVAVHGQASWARREVTAGRLRFHNMPLLRLVRELLASKTPDQATAFLRAHPELLGDEAWDELQSALGSAVATYINNGSSSAVYFAAYYREIVSLARQYGIDDASALCPVLPPILWMTAGILLGMGYRSVNWDEFTALRDEHPDAYGLAAILVREAYQLLNALVHERQQPSPDLTTPASTMDKRRLDSAALAQYVLRGKASEALKLILQNSDTVRSDAFPTVTGLRASVPGDSGVDQIARAVSSLAQTECTWEILAAMAELDRRHVDRLLRNGSDLCAVVAGLSTLIGNEDEAEKLGPIWWYDLCNTSLPLKVLNAILPHANPDLSARLTDVRQTVARVSEGGRGGELAHHAHESEGGSPFLGAIVGLLLAQSPDQVRSIVRSSPELRAARVTELAGHLIQSARDNGNEEQSMRMRTVLAWFFRVCREEAENDTGWSRPRSDLVDAERVEGLILRLESHLPAELWTPVSRADLDDTFFTILDSWIREVSMVMGEDSAELLRGVESTTLEWRDHFGARGPLHTRQLSDALRPILNDLDDERLYDAIAENGELCLSTEALDVIGDWRMTAQDQEQQSIVALLDDRISLLDAARRTSLGMAFHVRNMDPVTKRKVEQVCVSMGLDPTMSVVELVEMCISSPALANRMLREMPELIQSEVVGHDAPDEAIRGIRLASLLYRVQTALLEGLDAYIRLLFEDTMLSGPDASQVVSELARNMPLGYREQHEKAMRLAADPLTRSWYLGCLSDEEEQEIIRIDGVVELFLRTPTWPGRLALIESCPVLLTETACLRAELCLLGIMGEAQEINPTPDRLHALEEALRLAIVFLWKCRESSPMAAMRYVIGQLRGTDAQSAESAAWLRVLSHLPPWYAAQQTDTVDDSLVLIEQASHEEDLDGQDRAQIEASLGAHYTVRYETLWELADLDQAIHHCRNGLNMTDREGELKSIRRQRYAHSLLARFERYGSATGDQEEAIEILEAGLRMPATTPVRGSLLGEYGRALTMRAQSHGASSDLRKAISTLREAISLTSEGAQEWVVWHVALGIALGIHGLTAQQLASLQEAVRVFQRAEVHTNQDSVSWYQVQFGTARALLDLGHMVGELDVIDEAISRFRRLRKRDIAQHQLAEVYLRLGDAYRHRFSGTASEVDLDVSIEWYGESLKVQRAESAELIVCLNSLAHLLQLRADADGEVLSPRVVAIYERILSAPSIDRWPSLLITAAENLGSYLRRGGALREARLVYERALWAVEAARSSATLSDDRLRLGEDFAAIYAHLTHCCIETGDYESAFLYAMSAKARTFAEEVTRHGLQTPGDDVQMRRLRSELGDVRERGRVIRASLFGEDTDDDAPRQPDSDQASEELLQVKVREATIVRLLSDSARAQTSPQVPVMEEQRVVEIQAMLEEHHATLLEYTVTERGWEVFVVKPQSVEYALLSPSEPPWRDWVDRLVAAQEDPHKQDLFRVLASDLYGFFISPISSRMPESGTNLILATSGLMSLFPLTAMLHPGEGYLVEKYVLSVVPSAHLLSGTHHDTALRSVLAASHAGASDRKGFIPLTQAEAHKVVTCFPSGKHLTGDSLSVESLIEHVGEHDVLHFSGHGTLDWRVPEASGLVLPNGTLLSGHDLLTRLHLTGSSLVVLSACEVGLEVPRTGDEHFGLVRAFMCAGAPAIVASLWLVQDLPTLLLMTEFYERLTGLDNDGEAESIAAALRDAQLWLKNASWTALVERIEQLLEELRGAVSEQVIESLGRGRLALMMGYKTRPYPYSAPHFWASFQAYGQAF